MLESPWWERLWTLQEHVVGQNCETYLGRHKISLRYLEQIALHLYQCLPERLPRQYPNYISRLLMGAHSRALMETIIDRTFMDPVTYLHEVHFFSDKLAESMFLAAFLFASRIPVDKVYGLHHFQDLCLPYSYGDVDYSKPAAGVFEAVI